jgi:hypothetical protein
MIRSSDDQVIWVGDLDKFGYVRAHVPVLFLFSKSVHRFQRGDASMHRTEALTGYRTTISNATILTVAEQNKTRFGASGLGRLTRHYVSLNRQSHYAD